MDLLTNGRGVIVVMGTVTKTENGYFVQEENCNYLPEMTLHTNISVPNGVKAQKYKYIGGVFSLNEEYTPTNADIQNQLSDISIALATIMGV